MGKTTRGGDTGGFIGLDMARNLGDFGMGRSSSGRLPPAESYPATVGGRGRDGHCHAGPEDR